MNEKLCILFKFHSKFGPKSPIDNKSTLVQIMAFCLFGTKTLSEPMLTQFTDAYMWHYERHNLSHNKRLCSYASRFGVKCVFVFHFINFHICFYLEKLILFLICLYGIFQINHGLINFWLHFTEFALWAVVGWAVSIHLQTNCLSDWAQIWWVNTL